MKTNKEIKTIPTPKTILYSNELTPATILIYIYLVKELFLKRFSEKNFKLNKSILATKLNLSRITIINSIKQLQELELVDFENNEIYYKDINDNLQKYDEYSFSEKFAVRFFGGYIESPKAILYSSELTANEKITLLKIKSVKLDTIHLNGIATITNTERRTFTRNIKSLKEKGFLTYEIIATGEKINDSQIINLKVYEKSIKQNEEKESDLKSPEETNVDIEPAEKQLETITNEPTSKQEPNHIMKQIELEKLKYRKEHQVQANINAMFAQLKNKNADDEIKEPTKEELYAWFDTIAI